MLGNILLRITPKFLLIPLALTASPGICLAVAIGTDPIPPEFTTTGFGSSEVYRAQTFRLPSGSEAAFAKNLTVFVGPTTDSGANFHVLLTEVDMTSGFHPTNVIFESETLNVPVLPLRRDPDEFVVDLGRLLLQADRDYAWILDYFVVRDEGALVSMNTGLGSYPDGMAYSFPNGAFFPAGTREDHFSGNNWFEQEDHDFAFRLEFTSVSAPSVSSTSPADGTTHTPVDTIITATFSEEMDASTISDTTFLVDDGSNHVAGTVTYSDTTATFTPTTNLAYATIYNVTITNGVQDLAGNPLEDDYQWWFATETAPGRLGLTLDHFPLERGSQWVYSVSPSTTVLDFEGDTFIMNFADFEISIPADGQRRLETTFSGSVDGYSLSGDTWYEEEYVIAGGEIRLASEQGAFSLHVPSADASVTISAAGALLSPLTIFEHGMEVGESISFSGTEQVDVTVDSREGSTHEIDSESEDVSISGTTAVVGERKTAFNGDLVDTIEVQTESLIDGEPSVRTWHLARFIGPVSMQGDVLVVFEDFLQDADQFTCTLKSTNLPIWDSMNTYAVDSSPGAMLNVNLNGGTAAIEIPASCLSGSTTVTVGDISNIPDSPGVNGIAWALGINVDDPGISLTCPVTVTIPYTQSDLDDAGVSDPNDLKVYRWISPSAGWEALKVAAVDTVNQAISFEVSQLSVFGLGATSSGGGGGGGGACFIGSLSDSLGVRKDPVPGLDM